MPLLKTYYGVSDTSSVAQVQSILQQYFRVLDEVQKHVEEEEVIMFVAYVLILMCFVRIIIYLSVHPRIAVLSNTVAAASDNMMHFFIVFFFLFAVLAWLGCWSFGPDNYLFSSIGGSVNSSFRM